MLTSIIIHNNNSKTMHQCIIPYKCIIFWYIYNLKVRTSIKLNNHSLFNSNPSFIIQNFFHLITPVALLVQSHHIIYGIT